MTKAIRVKPPEIEVPKKDPFANDALDRETCARILTQFVNRISEPYVLALDSPWGTGKTTFIRMWVQSLENHGVPALYFNAWDTDFCDDPFIALVGELATSVEAIAHGDSKVRTGLDRVKKVAIAVAKRAIPVGIRIGTAGALDIDEEIKRELAGLAGELAKERIEEYEKAKNSISEFRSSLAETVEAVQQRAGKSTPIVFFIDELDRCRPNYAIALLEKAKHFFSVPGIVFVLALDKSQLLHSIRSVYGTEFDARGYLRRFVDMDYRLPHPKPGNYVRHLFDRMGVYAHFAQRNPQRWHEQLEEVSGLTEKLVTLVGFSLREQIQCISRLLVILNTIPDEHKLFDLELVTMTILREWQPELFDRFASGRITHKEVVAALESTPGGPSFFSDHQGYLVEAALASGASELAGDLTIIHEYKRISEDETAGSAMRERARRIDELIGSLRRHSRGPGMKYTLDRLALGQNFITRAESEKVDA